MSTSNELRRVIGLRLLFVVFAAVLAMVAYNGAFMGGYTTGVSPVFAGGDGSSGSSGSGSGTGGGDDPGPYDGCPGCGDPEDPVPTDFQASASSSCAAPDNAQVTVTWTANEPTTPGWSCDVISTIAGSVQTELPCNDSRTLSGLPNSTSIAWEVVLTIYDELGVQFTQQYASDSVTTPDCSPAPSPSPSPSPGAPPPVVSVIAGDSSVTEGTDVSIRIDTENVTSDPNAPDGPHSCTLTATNDAVYTSPVGWNHNEAGDGTNYYGFVRPLAPSSTYTAECQGVDGSTGSGDVTVIATPPSGPAPVVDLQANPDTITEGNSSTLSWTVTDADSCTASGAWSGGKTPGTDSESVSPSSTSDFTLTCSGSGGSDSDTVAVTVNPPVSPPAPAPGPAPAPVPPPSTECDDGVDNADTEDNEVDDNDPGCHTDGDPDDGDSSWNPDIASENDLILTADPRIVKSGGSSEISWDANGTNPNTCIVSGPDISATSESGSDTADNLTTESVFTFTCSYGTHAKSTSARVVIVPAFEEF